MRDAATLSGPPAFDLVTTFDAVHDQADPAAVLKDIHDLLNLDHPLGPLLYTVSCMHCMTVSLALGGDALGTVWGEQLALDMLPDAGFTDVTVHSVEEDILNSYYVARRA